MELGRTDREDGVWLEAVSEAREPTIAGIVEAMIEAGRAKFRGRQWGDYNVLVLDANGPNMTLDGVQAALSALTDADLEPLHFVFHVAGNAITLIWTQTER